MFWVHYGPTLREGGLTAESINRIIIFKKIIILLIILEAEASGKDVCSEKMQGLTLTMLLN